MCSARKTLKIYNSPLFLGLLANIDAFCRKISENFDRFLSSNNLPGSLKMRKGVEIFRKFSCIIHQNLPRGLKRRKRVKYLKKYFCRTHQIFARKPEKKKIRSIFSKIILQNTS